MLAKMNLKAVYGGKAALALIALVTTGQASRIVAQAPAPADTVVTIDFSKTRGPMPQPQRYNNLTDFDLYTQQRAEDARFYNEQGLHGSVYRVWLPERLYDPAKGAYDIAPLAAYLNDASAMSDAILLNIMPTHMVMDGKTPEQMKPVLIKLIRDLKQRYPKIKYIEAYNEPDHTLATKMQASDLYRYYVPFYEAVNAVNRELKPKMPIELGGPALFKFDKEWISAFLQGYAADTSPAKRLDFLSHHAYGYFYLKPGSTQMTKPPVFFKDDPSEVAKHRPFIEGELRKNGLDPHLPSFITEMGLYPGPSFDNFKDPRPDYLRQAAGLAALTYWFLESPDNVPFNWVLRHQTEERKDQLITRAGMDKPAPVRTFSPYGNAMLMMSKLKSERVEVAAPPLTAGKGIYTLATKDKTGVAVMVWNYQHIGEKTVAARIVMNKLPVALRNKRLRQRTFLIDDRTSNYWADPEHANLQQVEETALPASSVGPAIEARLRPNAVQLILLDRAPK